LLDRIINFLLLNIWRSN